MADRTALSRIRERAVFFGSWFQVARLAQGAPRRSEDVEAKTSKLVASAQSSSSPAPRDAARPANLLDTADASIPANRGATAFGPDVSTGSPDRGERHGADLIRARPRNAMRIA
ncbi:hypothetical protein CNO08_04835 [Lysobacter capsici]|nr:hypothetical protein CNO08_04835 [Lysobacter capsici]